MPSLKPIDWDDARSGTYRGAYRYPTEAERVKGYANRHANKLRRYRANLESRGLRIVNHRVVPILYCECEHCNCRSSVLESGLCGFCMDMLCDDR
jgi:hypothetical protein